MNSQESGEHQLNADGMRRFIRMDLQFHTMLVRAAANSRILKAVADTRVLLNIFGIRRKGHDAAQLTQIHRYHSEILAAIVRQDPQAASDCWANIFGSARKSGCRSTTRGSGKLRLATLWSTRTA